MCGILGRLNLDGSAIDDDLLRSMARAIVHRGPDDEGFYRDGSVGLGMRRLSIIDIATGHQPIFNEDKTVCIVYNGEMYNYKELTDGLLKRGHRFSTHSDTETIVHLYEDEGIGCVKRLNGMFAFALWDLKKQKLFLVRDRVGMKPLSYFLDEKKLVFSSEIKAILTNPDVRVSSNDSVIADYLIKGKYLYSDTFFEGIVHLPPGHYLEASASRIKLTEYWDFKFEPRDNVPQNVQAADLASVIEQSVKSQLMSEVPVGSYLSGGIDSSSVAAAVAKHSTFHLKTFSAVFPGQDAFNEDEYQQEVVKRYSLDHNENRLTSTGFLEDLKKLIWHIEQPLAGITIGQFQMARFTKQWVTVVLTGHGGDELFGGYPNHFLGAAMDCVKRSWYNPARWKELFGWIPVLRKELGWIKVAYNLILFAKPLPGLRKFIIGIYERTLRRRIFSRRFWKNRLTHQVIFDLLKRSDAKTWVDRMLYVDIKLWLHNILMVEDKESMAFSLEDRVPLLDNRILDLASSIPSEYKVRDFTLKWIVRKSQENNLPSSLLTHKKMGFPQPVGEWIRSDELADQVREIFADSILVKKKIVSETYMNSLSRDHWDRNIDRSFEVWQILCVELWYRIFSPKDKERRNG